jgi:hypothetical protein
LRFDFSGIFKNGFAEFRPRTRGLGIPDTAIKPEIIQPSCFIRESQAMAADAYRLGLTGVLVMAGSSAWAQSAPESASTIIAVQSFASPTLETPVGFGGSWGSVGVGIFGQTLPNSNEDASAGVAMGFGDPDAYFGAELGVGFSSLTSDNSEDSFGESGGFSFKLHRNLPGYSAVSVGVNGFGVWGGAEDFNDPSYYAAYSKMVPVGRFASILTIGAGTEVFNDPGEDGANVFGSAALYLTPQVALIGEYTGRFANAAVSIAPYSWLPMTVTVGAVNVTERFDADTELAVSVGFGFNFT